MQDQERPPLHYVTFGGLVTNADPRDIGYGAVRLENMTLAIPGQLSSRKGHTLLEFANDPGSGDANIMAMCRFETPAYKFVVCQLEHGGVYAKGDQASIGLIVDQNTLDTTYPANFAKDRAGVLYLANGIDRHCLWDGSTEEALRSGIKPPPAPAVVGDGTTGAVADGAYYCAYKYIDYLGRESELGPGILLTLSAGLPQHIDWQAIQDSTETDRVRYVDLYRTTAGQATTYYRVVRLGNHGTITATADSGGFCEFTLPLGHSLEEGAIITIAGHSVAGYNGDHLITAPTTSTSIVTDVPFTSAGTGTATWTIAGYMNEDDLDDDDLALNLALPVTNDDDSVNARRQGMPPSECAVLAWFQDRMFYAVQKKYTRGTVATTAGAQTITGTGLTWPQEFGGSDHYPARTGEWLMQIDGEPKPLRIVDWLNANQIRTTEDSTPTLTQSGASYVLYPDPKVFRNKILYSEVDEAESVPYDAAVAAENFYDGYLNAIPIQENTGDDDELTSLMPYGFALWAIKERHIYRITFSRQPSLEAAVVLVASRGCLNNRCWAQHEGLAYLMDSSGVYAFDTNSVEPISQAIHNLWRDGTIDFTNAEWFFASVDPADEVVRFYVQFAGDSGTRPTRALCYSIRQKAWTFETYPWQLGGACKADVGSGERLLVGAVEDAVYMVGEGYTDAGVTIAYAWRGGKLALSASAKSQGRALEVAFQPTAVQTSLTAKLYFDNRAAALTIENDNNGGNGVVLTAGSANIDIDMYQYRVEGEEQAGWARQEFGPVRGDKLTMTNRWVSVELTGTAPTTEQITVFGVTVVGAEAK